MTALAQDRPTKDIGAPVPNRGTFPIAANTRIFKGAMVALNSSGQAIPATTLAGGAVVVVGKASHQVDNRTGSELGGAAAAADVEVEYGCFGWENSAAGDAIANDDVGKPCYAVDDQTVALTDGGSARAAAGFISEVRDGKVFVHQSPAFASMAEAAAVADAGISLQKRQLVMDSDDLTDADGSQALNIGAALPANARILGVSIHTVTPFSGGAVADFTVDVGTAGDPDAIVDGADLFAAAVDGQAATRPDGIAPNKLFAAGGQLLATFACASDDVADATAGACTIDVLFAVLA